MTSIPPLLETVPPDETGSDTLIRYRYQAQLMIPFCLNCAVQGDVKSVFAEHFEDILVEYTNRWDFIQVKTRNQNLGPWKLSDTFGGLKSLWRSHRSVGCNLTEEVSYALFLEGAIAKNDHLNELTPSKNGAPPMDRDIGDDLIDKARNELSASKDDCKSFLKKVIVQPNQPTRQDVASRHVRLLSQIATGSTPTEIESAYERLVSKVLEAMSGECLGDSLLTCIKGLGDADQSLKDRVAKKRLTREVISSLLGSVAYGPSLLLKRLVETASPRPTDLEMKLLSGGADAKTIEGAKQLRANAAAREYEALASSYDNNHLEDVRQRLLILGNSVIQQFANEASPVIKAYPELLQTLMERASHCDPNRVFRQDAFFLMGEICVLADECKIDWGSRIA